MLIQSLPPTVQRMSMFLSQGSRRNFLNNIQMMIKNERQMSLGKLGKVEFGTISESNENSDSFNSITSRSDITNSNPTIGNSDNEINMTDPLLKQKTITLGSIKSHSSLLEKSMSPQTTIDRVKKRKSKRVVIAEVNDVDSDREFRPRPPALLTSNISMQN